MVTPTGAKAAMVVTTSTSTVALAHPILLVLAPPVLILGVIIACGGHDDKAGHRAGCGRITLVRRDNMATMMV